MNFAGHSLSGLLAGALAAVAVAAVAPRTLSTLSIPLLVPATVLVLVYLGAVYPDVDLRDSIPRRRLLPVLRAGALGGVAFAAFYRWDAYVALGAAILALADVETGPVVAGGVGLAVLGIGALLAVEPALDRMTGTHRTRTHSVAIHAVAAGALALALWHAAPLGRGDRLLVAVLPFAFVLGVAVHHLADDVG